MRTFFCAALALGMGTALLSCRHAPETTPEGDVATTVYLAKRVRTLVSEAPIAQAIAVRDGKILAVGGREQVLEAAGPGAKVVQTEGVIVPGLEDAHGHLSSLGRSLSMARLNGTTSPEEIVARLKAATPESYVGDWLVGRGWDQNDWPATKGAFPDRAVLDEAFPRTPVYLTRIDGHAAWVNGEALKRAGVTKETPDPEGGRILRRADGEPTGVLVDNAIDLVGAKIPPLTDEQLQHVMAAALKKVASVGLTSVHDAGMDLRTFELLQHWDMVGVLPIRVYAMAYGNGDEQEREAFLGRGVFKGRMLEMRAVKFLLDGALGSRGAALHQPYSDDPANSGLLLMSPEELERRARAFMERGFQVCVHAIGDRANTLVLDAIEKAEKETHSEGGRHRLEHAQILRKEDLGRLAKLGVIASMQPTHATSDMPWAEARVGPERIKGAYAWRSVLDAGARLAFGSDFPIEEPDPVAGLYAARTRQDAHGQPPGGWYPEQRLSGEEALRAFTEGAAYASFAEDRRGRLARGMDADFTVLSMDPVEAPAEELLHAKVLRTVVAGVEVYSAP